MEHNEKVYQVIISSDVNDRMYDHFEFLARVNVSAANNLLDGLLKDIRNLQTAPFSYPVYNASVQRKFIGCRKIFLPQLRFNEAGDMLAA